METLFPLFLFVIEIYPKSRYRWNSSIDEYVLGEATQLMNYLMNYQLVA